MLMWQKIDQIAKDRGWDRPSAYFANMEDDEEDDYEYQLSQGAKLSAYISKFEETLDGAVFAEGTMEDGKDDVEGLR